LRKKKKQKLKEQQFLGTFAYFSTPQIPDGIPTHLERVNFRIWDHVDDEQIEMMVTHVQSINMLDLDETEITNFSIELLSKLVFIKELRLKGCNEIDDDAILHLNNINGLELLHLGGTCISLDRLLQLSAAHPLRMLLISVDDPEMHQLELTTIAQRFPDCELIVNHKGFSIPKKEEDDYQSE
jgi:hypothetical protein